MGEGGAAVCGRGGVTGTALCCEAVDDRGGGVAGVLYDEVNDTPLSRLNSVRSMWLSCAVCEYSFLCHSGVSATHHLTARSELTKLTEGHD